MENEDVSEVSEEEVSTLTMEQEKTSSQALVENIKDLLGEKLEKLDTKLDEQLTVVKSDIAAGRAEICDKIDKVQVRIEEVNSSLRGDIKRIETDISSKLEPILFTSKKHSKAI